MDKWIRVNNVWLPVPVTYKVQRSDLDSEMSTRNERGVLKRDRIRQGIYKIYTTWKLPIKELSILTNAFEPESFTTYFYDVTSGKYVTAQMYAGDITAEVILPKDNDETWCEYVCNLIEN